MTLSDFELQQNFQRHGASRGLSATAELLVKLTIINCLFTSTNDSVDFGIKLINNILVRHYLWSLRLKQFSISATQHNYIQNSTNWRLCQWNKVYVIVIVSHSPAITDLFVMRAVSAIAEFLVFWFCMVTCLNTHGEVRHFGTVRCRVRF